MLGLNEGFSAAMLFFLLGMAALLLMFYKTLRGLDELLKSIREERDSVSAQLAAQNERLETLVQLQAEAGANLRRLVGVVQETEPNANESASRETPQNNLSSHNITEYLINE